MNETSAAAGAGPLGSWRHLMVLCGILLAIAAAGFVSSGRAVPIGNGSAIGGAALYLPLLAAEWGLLFYVRMGLHRRGKTVRGVISARPFSMRALAIDLVLGVLMFGAFLAAEYALDLALSAGRPAGVQPLLVRHAADIPLWILLALSAGFVEEVTYRGYLQRQFGALLGNRWFGVGAQAILFGVTHGYQGAMLVLEITIFGLMFGVLALCRRSLIPGIIAHAAVDVIGGLAAFR